MKKTPTQDAIDMFFAGLTPGMLIAGFAMALIGIFLSSLLSTTKRDPISERTPLHFSWKFFWSDNAKKFLKSVALTTIVLFLSMRFAQDLIGQKFSMIYSLALGLCLDKLIEKWRTIRDNLGNKILPNNKKDES